MVAQARRLESEGAQDHYPAEPTQPTYRPMVPHLSLLNGPAYVPRPISIGSDDSPTVGMAELLAITASSTGSAGSMETEPDQEPIPFAEKDMAVALAERDEHRVHEVLKENDPFQAMVEAVADKEETRALPPPAIDMADYEATLKVVSGRMSDGRQTDRLAVCLTQFYCRNTGFGLSIGPGADHGAETTAASTDRRIPVITDYTLGEFDPMMSIDGTKFLDTGCNIKASIEHFEIDPYVTHLEDPNGPISIPPPGVQLKLWWNPH